MSHPTWVRGLKLIVVIFQLLLILSHPTWVRGLKLKVNSDWQQKHGVASYMGAWIETAFRTAAVNRAVSHPTWVRGLKHQHYQQAEELVGRILHGCVD